jgi:hypothetical protein
MGSFLLKLDPHIPSHAADHWQPTQHIAREGKLQKLYRA